MSEDDLKISKPKFYYFEKWIFRGVVFCIFLLFLYSLFTVGFTNKVYAYCPEGSFVCDNPFYNNCDMLTGKDDSVLQAKYFCNQTTILGGTTIGTPPTWFMKNHMIFVFLFLLIGFLMNHFLYNKPSQLLHRRLQLLEEEKSLSSQTNDISNSSSNNNSGGKE